MSDLVIAVEGVNRESEYPGGGALNVREDGVGRLDTIDSYCSPLSLQQNNKDLHSRVSEH